ncbi:MAG TPA: 50S ribosomal protein L10 [Candidatus Fimadaptatus faecigallinarum]|uniref:Large ribosomal subunit protein uL10 n=1 Tax=Candidatus Fimadaptatus faecigallinarum TaxID=2840814 RepID=A0A9D1LSV9_9FIRM|nr:50S ribosomal protein L10 [Candidatus Fimadaptatus faecigallinarum]
MARRCIRLSQAQEQKKLVVAGIREKLENAKSVVFIDYCGLTVAEVTELRNEFRKAGVEYQVLKNTLIKIAAHDLGITGLDDILNGPTAVAFSMEDPASGAKVISEFAKKTKKTEVKAGLLDKEVLDVKGVQALADLPPKEVLIARIMGSLNAPITNFVGVLSATLRSLVYAIDAVRKSKEEG